MTTCGKKTDYIDGARKQGNDCGKKTAFAKYRMRGLAFIPFAIESYGYGDQQNMQYIRHLATAAASAGKVKYGSFLASVHREISVAWCKGNHAIFRAGVQMYTRDSGHARLPGLRIPTAEVE